MRLLQRSKVSLVSSLTSTSHSSGIAGLEKGGLDFGTCFVWRAGIGRVGVFHTLALRVLWRARNCDPVELHSRSQTAVSTALFICRSSSWRSSLDSAAITPIVPGSANKAH